MTGHGSLAKFTIGTDDEGSEGSGARLEVPMGDDEMSEVVSDRVPRILDAGIVNGTISMQYESHK